ncbi:cold-shock protein [Streptomyces sp. NPDC093992]
MASGVVKWFDPLRGLGLVAPDGGGFDAVAQRSAVRGGAGRELVTGRRVHFDLTRDATGVQADNIRPVLQGPCTPAEEPEVGAAPSRPG